jgi:acetylglutamate/LysW-gamma-L-alpha-aminoadipate kinase
MIRDDYSGTITGINADLLHTLLEAGMTPVIAPLAIGEEFERLNVDGDLVAANIVRELHADTLIILSNVPGLLHDVNDSQSLVSQFELSEIERYEAYAAGRMKKKLLAAQQANAARVILADSRVERPIDAALAGGGTHILQAVGDWQLAVG